MSECLSKEKPSAEKSKEWRIYAEGCASPHSGELLQYINISKRSLGETQYLREFAHKIGLIDAKDVSALDQRCPETERMLKALNLSLTKKRSSGK